MRTRFRLEVDWSSTDTLYCFQGLGLDLPPTHPHRRFVCRLSVIGLSGFSEEVGRTGGLRVHGLQGPVKERICKSY